MTVSTSIQPVVMAAGKVLKLEMSIAMFFHAGFFASFRVLQVFAGFLQVFRV